MGGSAGPSQENRHTSGRSAKKKGTLPIGGVLRSALPAMVKTEADLDTAFASMVRQKAGAAMWLGGAPFSTPSQTDQLVESAAKARVPMLFSSRAPVDRGGLMSYAPTYEERYGKAAMFVDRILKGAKPAD